MGALRQGSRHHHHHRSRLAGTIRTAAITTTTTLLVLCLLPTIIHAYIPLPNMDPSQVKDQASVSPTTTTTTTTTPHPHKTVIDSFEAREFRPLWWARQSHIQTIVGSRALQDNIKKIIQKDKAVVRWHDVYDRRERWNTPDGDWFHVDFLKARGKIHPSSSSSSSQQGPRPIVVALHGLESTSTAVSEGMCSFSPSTCYHHHHHHHHHDDDIMDTEV